MGIKDPKRQPQFAAGDFRASKLDKDADSHGIDPERECCECVENTVADENTWEGVERGEVEVGCDVAEDDAEVGNQVVDQEAKGDLSKGGTVDIWPEKLRR